jgi:predicted MPP superfamily phosphohydrolase
VFYLIIAAVGLGNVAWWRWADRRLRDRAPRRRTLRALVAIFAGVQVLYLLYFILAPRSARRVHPWLPMPTIASVYLWSLLILPASLVGIGIGKILAALNRLRRRYSSANENAQAISRRQWLTDAAVLAPPLVTALATGRAMWQLGDFRVRPLHVTLPGLPPNLDGLRIAHVSDIHVGRYTRRGTLPRIVEATNRLRADLVLFTGDLIDLSLDDLDRGTDAMKQLDPRAGFAMIEGNHDLIENPDAFEHRTVAAGLRLLVDQAMTIAVRGERIQLLGMRWGSATGNRRASGGQSFHESLQHLLPHREPGAFPIVLAHHPHAFDAAAAAGLPLTLSGHTHGGQLMLSERLGFGPVFFRYWSGLYRKANSQLVVSNGIGNWFPLRIQAPAEIIEITLHSA